MQGELKKRSNIIVGPGGMKVRKNTHCSTKQNNRPNAEMMIGRSRHNNSWPIWKPSTRPNSGSFPLAVRNFSLQYTRCSRKNKLHQAKIPRCWSYFRFSDRPYFFSAVFWYFSLFFNSSIRGDKRVLRKEILRIKEKSRQVGHLRPTLSGFFVLQRFFNKK